MYDKNDTKDIAINNIELTPDEIPLNDKGLNPEEVPEDRWKVWGRKYFEVIQELFDDILFYVDIKEKRLAHIAQGGEQVGMLKVQYDFPCDFINSGMIHPDDTKAAEIFGDNLLAGQEGTMEIRIKEEGGQYEWYMVSCIIIRDKDNNPIESIGRFANIQLQKDMEIRARIDCLTKAQNRMAFEENVERTLNEATLNQSHALIFIDIDDFKSINDNHGHIFGDFILSKVSQRLLKGVQATDYVGRIGGDEFVILMKNVQDPNVIQSRADQLLVDIHKKICGEEMCFKIQASIGVARFPMDGLSYTELYHKADQALYQSKALGKNVATLYSENLIRPQEAPIRRDRGYSVVSCYE